MVATVNNLNDHCAIRCRLCNNTHVIIYNHEDMIDWLTGSKFIQDAMWYLSAGDRELLISSTCSDCFDKLFPPDLDNNF